MDEDGQRHAIGSADVNAYLREIAGEEFTAKDFRTWAGTVLAASALRDGVFESEPEAKRNVARAIETVAKRLGNTPAICRKCYVHPAVVEAYFEKALPQGAAPADGVPTGPGARRGGACRAPAGPPARGDRRSPDASPASAGETPGGAVQGLSVSLRVAGRPEPSIRRSADRPFRGPPETATLLIVGCPRVW